MSSKKETVTFDEALAFMNTMLEIYNAETDEEKAAELLRGLNYYKIMFENLFCVGLNFIPQKESEE